MNQHVNQVGGRLFSGRIIHGEVDQKPGPFSITKSNKVDYYDPKLVSPNFEQYQEYYYQDLGEEYPGQRGYQKLINLAYQIFPYELITPKNLMHDIQYQKPLRTYQYRKETGIKYGKERREYQIDYWLGQKIDKTILRYQFITQVFPIIHEMIYKFELDQFKHKINVAEISSYPGSLEAVKYSRGDVYRGDNYDWFWMKYTLNDLVVSRMQNLKKLYLSIFDPNVVTLEEKINSDLIKEKQKRKYHFIQVAPRVINYRYQPLAWEFINAQSTFAATILALSRQAIKGNLIIYLDTIKLQITLDLIVILKSHYSNVKLYRPEIMMDFKETGVFLVCRTFQGFRSKTLDELLKVLDEWNKIDPSGGKNLNQIDLPLNFKCQIPDQPTDEKNIDSPNKFMTSYLKSNPPKLNKIIRDFNDEFYQNTINYLKDMIRYRDLLSDFPEYRMANQRQMKEKQLNESILWANKYNLSLRPNLEKPIFADRFGRVLMQDLYSPDETINFRFQSYRNLSTPRISYRNYRLPESLLEVSRQHHRASNVIDTRDRDLYNNVKNRIKFYRRDLAKLIQAKYSAEFVSQAWLKMYEILHTFHLISSRAKTAKTFHMCELPGAFILSTNHYLKTRTETRDFDWHAQSLNPTMRDDINGLTDQFGMVKKYPDRWHFGVNQTGDVRDPDNIRSYRKICQNIDLMTSDCGLNWTEKDELASSLFYGQALFIFNNLPKGANVVYKLYLPYDRPIKISMIYLMYLHFREFYFYKPYQNPQSEEYYVIGKSYRGMDQNLLDQLFKVLDEKKFDPEYSLFDPQEIPDKFMVQLEKVGQLLVDKYQKTLDRVIYHVDNYHQISSKYWKEMDQLIEERNQQWLDQFRIKPLSSREKLL